MLSIFGVKDIVNFILDRLDQPICCFQHLGNNGDLDSKIKVQNYPLALKLYFSIMETILLLKRLDADIEQIV